MLGLPNGIKALLFDLDGVLSQTAKVHAAAWKEMFDEYLKAKAQREGGELVPFDAHDDYDEYVDGLPREDGVRSFLRSRGIHPDEATVKELSDRKNKLVLEIIKKDGVQAYDGSLRYVTAAHDAGLKMAVVSSSANAKEVLKAIGILDAFDTVVDGRRLTLQPRSALGGGSGRQREEHLESAARPVVARMNVTVVCLDEPTGYREPEPPAGALLGSAGRHPAERDVEDAVEVLLRDPAAGVVDTQPRLVARDSGHDDDGAVGRRVPDRVGEQVAHDARELGVAAEHDGPGGVLLRPHYHALASGRDPFGGNGLGHHLAKGHRGQRQDRHR